MRIYVVDSNFFIQAHRESYPLDIAFSFWNKVKQLAEKGIIISIDKVKNEIYDKNDDLENWCIANLPKNFFKSSSEVMVAYSQVSEWAVSKSSHYSANALNEFLDADEADAFIIAYALSNPSNVVIVTHEKSQPEIKRKIKIPEACNTLKVKYVNTIEMLRQLGETF